MKHITQQINYQNSSSMEKEILELVVLGLQRKERFSTENIVNALASLSEEQQHRWIKTMLSNGNESESKEFVLKVTPSENISKIGIIEYVKQLLDCPLKEAKDLVFRNETFELKLSEPRVASAYTELKNLHCEVTMHSDT